MQNRTIPLVSLSLLLLTVPTLRAATLSVNFTHPTEANGLFAQDANTLAGVVPAGNWNTITNGGKTGTLVGPVLDDGSVEATTTVTIGGGSSSSPNYFTSETGTPADNDHRLMWYTFGSDNRVQYSTIEVSGLGAAFAAGFDIYVYSHRNLSSYAGVYQFDLDLASDDTVEQTVFGRISASGNFAGFNNQGQALTALDAGDVNYVVFSVGAGVDAFRLLVDNLDGDRKALNGIQIVAANGPAPSDPRLRARLTPSSVELDFETQEGFTYRLLQAAAPNGPYSPTTPEQTLSGNGQPGLFSIERPQSGSIFWAIEFGPGSASP